MSSAVSLCLEMRGRVQTFDIEFSLGRIARLKLVRYPHSLVASRATLPSMSLIPFAPLYLGSSRRARPLPHGFTGHVAHPIRSIETRSATRQRLSG